MKRFTRIHVIVISAILILFLPLLGFPGTIETTLIMILAGLVVVLGAFQLYFDHLFGTDWARSLLGLLKRKFGTSEQPPSVESYEESIEE